MIGQIRATARTQSEKISRYLVTLVFGVFFLGSPFNQGVNYFSAAAFARSPDTTLQLGSADTIISDPVTSLALFGYDPVAYFVDSRAVKGTEDNQERIGGFLWRFVNDGNKVEFVRNPDVYYPKFGGYDPIAILEGQIASGDPTIFLVSNGSLYFFRNTEHKQKFIDEPTLAALSVRKWENLSRELIKP